VEAEIDGVGGGGPNDSGAILIEEDNDDDDDNGGTIKEGGGPNDAGAIPIEDVVDVVDNGGTIKGGGGPNDESWSEVVFDSLLGGNLLPVILLLLLLEEEEEEEEDSVNGMEFIVKESLPLGFLANVEPAIRLLQLAFRLADGFMECLDLGARCGILEAASELEVTRTTWNGVDGDIGEDRIGSEDLESK